jgi:hypothetical protein
MERPARPLPPVLTATTDVGDLSATSAAPHLVPDSAGITDGAGCVERRGHAAVFAAKLTHSSQANTQPLTGRTMRVCSRVRRPERSWLVLATGRLD